MTRANRIIRIETMANLRFDWPFIPRYISSSYAQKVLIFDLSEERLYYRYCKCLKSGRYLYRLEEE